jgi:ATP-dependent exoDNAse (exonuclease V) alpha subunit
VARILKNRGAVSRWHEAKVLIIDEISMLSGELFENLEAAARKVRKNPAPFGGIQLIACGDFFQVRTRVIREQAPRAATPNLLSASGVLQGLIFISI